MAEDIVDCIIVGGGPAGLSAAVYMGRFLRSTVVIDGGGGRSSGPQTNENYLGFPRGIPAKKLRELGRRQAERFGVRFIGGTVANAERVEEGFLLSGDCGEWRARTVIIATGVTDIWPSFPDVQRYVGRSLFWCITCDGFRTRDKRTVLIGATDAAAVDTEQFLLYTDKLTFIDTGKIVGAGVSERALDSMREHGIEVVEGRIDRVIGARGMVRQVVVNGQKIDCDLLFSLLGAVPNSALAAQLGVLLNDDGYIKIDIDQHTSVPCVYAAGDVTGPFSQQIAAAVHEGAQAAQAANYDLYPAFQRG